jgi:hypothetical protein
MYGISFPYDNEHRFYKYATADEQYFYYPFGMTRYWVRKEFKDKNEQEKNIKENYITKNDNGVYENIKNNYPTKKCDFIVANMFDLGLNIDFNKFRDSLNDGGRLMIHLKGKENGGWQYEHLLSTMRRSSFIPITTWNTKEKWTDIYVHTIKLSDDFLFMPNRKRILTIVTPAIKIPDRQFIKFLGWNNEVLNNRPNTKLLLVVDRDISGIIKQFTFKNNNVEFIIYPKGQKIFNLSATNNYGIKRSNSDIIVKGDVDVQWTTTAIDYLFNKIKTTGTMVSLVYGKVERDKKYKAISEDWVKLESMNKS